MSEHATHSVHESSPFDDLVTPDEQQQWLTICNETKSAKWTLVATLLPVALGVLVTLTTATLARWLGWV